MQVYQLVLFDSNLEFSVELHKILYWQNVPCYIISVPSYNLFLLVVDLEEDDIIYMKLKHNIKYSDVVHLHYILDYNVDDSNWNTNPIYLSLRKIFDA
jgi:hypothetical protein